MNLNQNPTKEQLKSLFSSCDDTIGHHVLWVARNGDVALNPHPSDLISVGTFDHANPDILLRYETFRQGTGYVGQQAAENEKFIERMFKSLQREWPTVTDRSPQRYVDLF